MFPLSRDKLIGLSASSAFVVIWATGFVGAKATMGHAEPLWLLFMRFVATAVFVYAMALVLRRPWPRSLTDYCNLAVAGFLMHVVYLGAMFSAIHIGLQANTVSIIVSVQPLLTAAFAAAFLGEVVTRRKWLGLFLGAAGVIITILGKLSADLGTPLSMCLAVLSLAGISSGTLYQKRFCSNLPMLPGLVVQYAFSATVCLVGSLLLETQTVDWTTELILGLAWLVLVLSCSAIMLLYFLIKRGAAANVASLFFLVPGFTAIFAWLLYREPLGLPAFIGLGLVTIAVLIVNTGAAPASKGEAAE